MDWAESLGGMQSRVGVLVFSNLRWHSPDDDSQLIMTLIDLITSFAFNHIIPIPLQSNTSTTKMSEATTVCGPLQSLYRNLKSYLPKTQNYQLVASVDGTVVKAVEGCDRVVLSALGSAKKVAKKIPSPQDVKKYVAKKSHQQLGRIEKWLGSVVESLGGQAQEARGEVEYIVDRLLNILEKSIEMNSLLIKHTFDTGMKYLKSPSTLAADGKRLIRSIYIQIASLTIALRELITETSKQILGNIGAKYTETRDYVRLLLTDLRNSEKAYQMISNRLAEMKKVTVRFCKKGIEIAVDKKHYQSNFNKMVSAVVRRIGDALMDLEQRYDYAVSYGKELYEKTVRNYRIQKILLSSKKIEVIQVERVERVERKGVAAEREEEVPTSETEMRSPTTSGTQEERMKASQQRSNEQTEQQQKDDNEEEEEQEQQQQQEGQEQHEDEQETH